MKGIFSYVDAGYRANILHAIDLYELQRPDQRSEDVRCCRDIVQAEYHSNALLVYKLQSYLTTITTGFRIFGVDAWRIQTGHSLLKNLISQALKTRSSQQLLDYEQRIAAEIQNLYKGESLEELIGLNKSLALELSMSKHQQELLENNLLESKTQCKTLLIEKNKLSQELLELKKDSEQRAFDYVELDKKRLILMEEHKQLLNEVQELRMTRKNADALSIHSSPARDGQIYFSPFCHSRRDENSLEMSRSSEWGASFSSSIALQDMPQRNTLD